MVVVVRVDTKIINETTPQGINCIWYIVYAISLNGSYIGTVQYTWTRTALQRLQHWWCSGSNNSMGIKTAIHVYNTDVSMFILHKVWKRHFLCDFGQITEGHTLEMHWILLLVVPGCVLSIFEILTLRWPLTLEMIFQGHKVIQKLWRLLCMCTPLI